ncbi:MAG: glycosyl transferase, partial [Acidobacteria bacterium]|nr:glycosyl transferase [Acidobacteriota bacterium]
DLERIGGFEAILDYLADDYELGRRIHNIGLKIVLSRSVVETLLPAYGVRDYYLHQLRWARTIRSARPSGYVGLLVTFTVFWSVVTLFAVRGAAWAWFLLAAAVLVRAVVALTMARLVLRDRETLRALPLVVIRDLLAVFFWVTGLLGRKIVWRGEKFQLRTGLLVRLGQSE